MIRAPVEGKRKIINCGEMRFSFLQKVAVTLATLMSDVDGDRNKVAVVLLES